MPHALFIRHVACEDGGTLADVLSRHGWRVAYWDIARDDAPSSPLDCDLLVVLGGPVSANDEAEFPFLDTELAWLKERLAAEAPTLGICLGAQLMAKALGSRVHAAPAKELGWGPIQLTDAGRRSLLAPWEDPTREVLHWHGDTFDLPPDATLLASTPACRNQAFAMGEHALALQFHPEVTARGLEAWFVSHSFEIGCTAGASVSTLRAATARQAPVLEEVASQAWEAWLARIGEGRVARRGFHP